MGRHRHAPSVREDGLAAVLGALLDDRRVTAAALVDLDSGMVLDACGASSRPPSDGDPPADLDALGAGHAELMRVALGVLAGRSAPTAVADYELVLGCPAGPHHLLWGIPDPHGDRVVLSVVVAGSARNLKRVRRRLRTVSPSALTAGPTVSRRPGTSGWRLGLPERPAEPLGTAPRPDPATAAPPRADPATAATWPLPSAARPAVEDHGRPAPPSALPPAPRRV